MDCLVETWWGSVTAPSWPKFCKGGLGDITASGAWQTASTPVATHEIISDRRGQGPSWLALPPDALLPHPLPSHEAGWAFGKVSNAQRASPKGKLLPVRWWQVSGRGEKIKHIILIFFFFFFHYHFLMLSISLNQSCPFCFRVVITTRFCLPIRQRIINTLYNIQYVISTLLSTVGSSGPP